MADSTRETVTSTGASSPCFTLHSMPFGSRTVSPGLLPCSFGLTNGEGSCARRRLRVAVAVGHVVGSAPRLRDVPLGDRRGHGRPYRHDDEGDVGGGEDESDEDRLFQAVVACFAIHISR